MDFGTVASGDFVALLRGCLGVPGLPPDPSRSPSAAPGCPGTARGRFRPSPRDTFRRIRRQQGPLWGSPDRPHRLKYKVNKWYLNDFEFPLWALLGLLGMSPVRSRGHSWRHSGAYRSSSREPGGSSALLPEPLRTSGASSLSPKISPGLQKGPSNWERVDPNTPQCMWCKSQEPGASSAPFPKPSRTSWASSLAPEVSPGLQNGPSNWERVAPDTLQCLATARME